MTELGPKGTAGGGYQLWLRGQTEQHGGSGLQQVWESPGGKEESQGQDLRLQTRGVAST